MPSPKRKTRRNPLQRLSDQRRSLALAGLAVGAVFSAAIFRRKRRGGDAEFEQPTPTTPQPEVAATAAAAEATQVDHEAPETAAAIAAEITSPADEVAPDDEPAINESTPVAEESAGATSDAADEEDEPAPVEPATGELSAEEASILAVLAQHGRADDDRTVIAVATSLERESGDVSNVLRKLSAEGVVSGELYTATGDKIWAVTERGVRRLGAQH